MAAGAVDAMGNPIPREGELVAKVTVQQMQHDASTKLCTVTAQAADESVTVTWVTRPMPAIGQIFSIMRFGSGEVYAIGETGDRHQVSEIHRGMPGAAGADPPFPPAPDDLVEEATRRAEELGLRLQFRRTGVVVHAARGAIKQPFIETWEHTLELVGLG